MVTALRRDELLLLERDPQGRVARVRWVGAPGGDATAPRIAGPAQEAVRFGGPSGSVTGTLLWPEGAGPFPAVLLVAGSGPTSRDNVYLRAREFVRLGVAPLTLDRRGVGETEGDYFTATLEDAAGDAAAGLAYLQSRLNVEASRVGLAGHSQGVWVASLAAARAARPPAWLILTSGGPVHPAEQEAWRAAAAFMRRKWEFAFTGADWPGYLAAARAAMGVPWAGVVRPLLVADSAAWAFMRSTRDFDPLGAAAALTMPVLVLFGDADDQQPVERARERWLEAFGRSGHTEHEIVTLPGAGHSLWFGGGSPTPLFSAPTEAIRRWLLPRLNR